MNGAKFDMLKKIRFVASANLVAVMLAWHATAE